MSINERIQEVVLLCDKVAEGLIKRSRSVYNCMAYCPSEQILISATEVVLTMIDKQDAELMARQERAICTRRAS